MLEPFAWQYYTNPLVQTGAALLLGAGENTSLVLTTAYDYDYYSDNYYDQGLDYCNDFDVGFNLTRYYNRTC